jgi:hypothetical protein
MRSNNSQNEPRTFTKRQQADRRAAMHGSALGQTAVVASFASVA